MKPKLLSARALARELGISPPTIASLEAKGLITPEFRIERLVRYDLQKVLNQLKAARTDPPTPMTIAY
jgi:DNA-binding transcriptional regulator YhcF (GntR family)